MKKLYKALALVLAIALTAFLSVNLTLAYLTDTDEEVNVMTLGNVSIEQHEYERATNEDGTYKTAEIDGVTSYVLKGFTQGKPLYPATDLDANGLPYNNGAGDYDATTVRMTQVDSYGSMDVFVNSNAQDKFVTVENTGKSDAYVRTLIAFEVGATNTDLIGMSYHQTWTFNYIGVITVDGNNYDLVEFIYKGGAHLGGVHENGVLPAGETSYPSLAQVYMNATATNEDVAAIDGNKNGTYDILVFSQAVQTEGFDDAETALNAGFGDITTDNHPWATKAPAIPPVVDNGDDLKDALENGEDAVFGDDIDTPADGSNGYGSTAIVVSAGQYIDGGNHVLRADEANGTWDSAITAYGGTVKNLRVEKGFRGLFISHNNSEPAKNGKVYIENVYIDGCTYTISCDQGTGNGLEATDCTFNGWTSYAGTLGDALFVDCSFGEGNGYAFCRPYAPTTFVGCDFEAGYEMDPRAAVTFENCTIGGVALTADNLATLVTSNIQNASVK